MIRKRLLQRLAQQVNELRASASTERPDDESPELTADEGRQLEEADAAFAHPGVTDAMESMLPRQRIRLAPYAGAFKEVFRAMEEREANKPSPIPETPAANATPPPAAVDVGARRGVMKGSLEHLFH
jgi:hypothetical protein